MCVCGGGHRPALKERYTGTSSDKKQGSKVTSTGKAWGVHSREPLAVERDTLRVGLHKMKNRRSL